MHGWAVKGDDGTALRATHAAVPSALQQEISIPSSTLITYPCYYAGVLGAPALPPPPPDSAETQTAAGERPIQNAPTPSRCPPPRPPKRHPESFGRPPRRPPPPGSLALDPTPPHPPPPPRFNEIKEMYKKVNDMVGDIVKGNPSSKMVGDLAIFMVKNDLTSENICEKAKNMAVSRFRSILFQGYDRTP